MSKDIQLYALSTCVHCKKMKEYLDECGVKYNCVFVDQLKGDERREAIHAVKTHNAAVSFPTVVIGDSVVVGFKKDKVDEALK